MFRDLSVKFDSFLSSLKCLSYIRRPLTFEGRRGERNACRTRNRSIMSLNPIKSSRDCLARQFTLTVKLILIGSFNEVKCVLTLELT